MVTAGNVEHLLFGLSPHLFAYYFSSCPELYLRCLSGTYLEASASEEEHVALQYCHVSSTASPRIDRAVDPFWRILFPQYCEEDTIQCNDEGGVDRDAFSFATL